MAEDLSKWSRGEADRAVRLVERGEWAECVALCDRAIERLAGVDTAELMEIRVHIRQRRYQAARELRRQGEHVPPPPAAAWPSAGAPAQEGHEMSETQEHKCRECGKGEPDATFKVWHGKKVGVCDECQNKSRKAKALQRARAAKAAKREAEDAPVAPEQKAPAMDTGELGRLTSEALTAVRAAAGCRTVVEATPHLMDVLAAVVRIEQMAVASGR